MADHTHTLLQVISSDKDRETGTQSWPEYLFSYVYWNLHHLDSWVKRDLLDVTCFIISLFNVQHVSEVNTTILRTLRLIWWVISWVVLIWFDVCWCYFVVWLWRCGIRMQVEALGTSTTTHEITQHISRKVLRMVVLTSETYWTLNKEIIKQVTSSWSLFTQPSLQRFLNAVKPHFKYDHAHFSTCIPLMSVSAEEF